MATKSKNKYKLKPKSSNLKGILDSSEIINHDLKPEFITLHVRSAK